MTSGSRRRPWTLRRQLVVLLIGLVLVICSVLAVVSSLSLRAQLTRQLDSDLLKASARTANRPQDMLGIAPGTDPSTLPAPGPADPPDPAATPTTPTTPVPGKGFHFQDPILGQAAGTIDVVFSGTEVLSAGYVDDESNQRELTEAQLAVLEALPTDGVVRQVDLPGLGSFRAVSTTDRSGNQVITAMSTRPVDAPLKSYVLVEVLLIVLAVGLAAAASTLLVRRALRPLERVAGTALRVSELPLDRGEVAAIQGVARQDTDTRTEVGTVGAALNRMLGHVESSLAARHESETQVRQFVADASHELRTPLASIRGYAELVRRSPDEVPPDTRRALDRIESEALRMGALVEDLLLLARLDAGRPLERAEVDLVTVAVDALADAHAASRDHVWELDLPGSQDDDLDEDVTGPDTPLDVVIRGDEARLRQVFVNLLSNARVHTPAGTHVTLGLRGESEAVVVVVSDDGPGIPPTLLPSLFRRFSRGDSARNRVGGSTGLGLAIAQAIVQEHGGTLAARNDGRTGGAVFEVRLPRGVSSSQP